MSGLIEFSNAEIDQLYYLAGHLLSSETHPEDPNSDASAELAMDGFRDIVAGQVAKALRIKAKEFHDPGDERYDASRDKRRGFDLWHCGSVSGRSPTTTPSTYRPRTTMSLWFPMTKNPLCRVGLHGRRLNVVGVRRFEVVETGYEGERWTFQYVETSGDCRRCGKPIRRDLYQLHPDFDRYAREADQRGNND